MSRRLFLLLALISLTPGCYTVPGGSYSEGTPETALHLYHDARTDVWDEEPEEARRKLEEAVAVDPIFVKAHRLLQDLALEECGQGALLISHGALLEYDPSEPAYQYLLGRLFTRPENQISYFKKAVDLDPAFYWGHCGLGFATAAAGRPWESMRHFEEAARLYPDVDVWREHGGR